VKEEEVERKSLPGLLNIMRGDEKFGTRKDSTSNTTLIIE